MGLGKNPEWIKKRSRLTWQSRSGSLTRTQRLASVLVSLMLALVAGLALAPTAQASVSATYWWGKSTWYSQSEVKRLQPPFRRMSDIALAGGGGAAGVVCAAMGAAALVPGLACGAIVALGSWHLADQASKLDYAASRKMCARLDASKLGIVTVTPYSCSWK